jgi:pimeloyl-ACP methyl ester carboxylesterase
MVTLPETRYARNNGLHVAYQLVGDGPVDIVLLTQWFSNIDSQWDVPPLAAFVHRLARFGRVLTFDKRGTGLSDPVPASELPSIEEWMDDLRTVMDESGIDRAVLVANLASSFMAMVFAATYPARELLERHHALVRSELARFRGREVDTAGDGFLAVFDGPGPRRPVCVRRRQERAVARNRDPGRRSHRRGRGGRRRGPRHRCPYRCPCVGPRERKRSPRQLDSARPGRRVGSAIRRPWFLRAQGCARPMAGSRAHRWLTVISQRCTGSDRPGRRPNGPGFSSACS